jgi:putative tryptophan/tyrosine transport system substrate-binding protein
MADHGACTTIRPDAPDRSADEQCGADPEGQARAAAFRQGLQALGWTEGKNLRIDWHWTAGDIGRIRGDLTELAGRPPDIIVANGRAILSELCR